MKYINNDLIWALQEVLTGDTLTVYFENFTSLEGHYVVTWGIRDESEMGYTFNTLVDNEADTLDYKQVQQDMMGVQQYLQDIGYEAHLHIDITGGFLNG